MSYKWERWNKEELAILKKHYPNMPRDDLMKLLPGRTWRAISHQAEKQEIHRSRYGSTRSKEYLAELHIILSTARTNRIDGHAPFTGRQHNSAAKLAISVSNLYARFHCVADIAALKGITEKEVRDIIEKRDKKRKRVKKRNDM